MLLRIIYDKVLGVNRELSELLTGSPNHIFETGYEDL